MRVGVVGGIVPKEQGEAFEVMEMFSLLIVRMISSMCIAKIDQICAVYGTSIMQ